MDSHNNTPVFDAFVLAAFEANDGGSGSIPAEREQALGAEFGLTPRQIKAAATLAVASVNDQLFLLDLDTQQGNYA